MVCDVNLSYSVAGGYVKMKDLATGAEFQAKEFLQICGRIANDHPQILGLSTKGGFYTPLLVRRNGNCLGHSNGKFYKSDGKTELQLESYGSVESLQEICLPTIISNMVPDAKPNFYNLIANGENALRIANISRGDHIKVAGEVRECWIGKQSISVIWVNEIIEIRKKGAPNDQVRR